MSVTATSLDQALSARRLGPGRHELLVPDGWQQGRGAFGGLVLGGMVRAITSESGDTARRLRSLTAEIVGPVQVGPATIEVELLRRGSAVSTLRAVLRQGDETLAHAVAVLGSARPGAPSWQRLPPPVMPSWQETPEIPDDHPFLPVFARHFEYRPVGPPPFMGADEPTASGWLRPRARAERRDDAYLTSLADVWWLAGAAVFEGPRPFATIAFSLELLAPVDDLPLDTPFFHRAVAPAASEGYVSEYRELWAPDGRLLALNHQVMVVIK